MAKTMRLSDDDRDTVAQGLELLVDQYMTQAEWGPPEDVAAWEAQAADVRKLMKRFV